MPRFTERALTDRRGLRTGNDLPYNLRPEDVIRVAEDVHDLLHEVNSMMVARSFDRMEELLDPAGFSGFVSRSVVDRFAGLSRPLVKNTYHNGYPDLLPYGTYAGDAVQHGTKGGLEVKASRHPSVGNRTGHAEAGSASFSSGSTRTGRRPSKTVSRLGSSPS